MLELGVKFLLSYFIGSLMGSLIMGKLKGGVDIRTQGSGNAGGTNALRTQGLPFAIGVIIIDIGTDTGIVIDEFVGTASNFINYCVPISSLKYIFIQMHLRLICIIIQFYDILGYIYFSIFSYDTPIGHIIIRMFVFIQKEISLNLNDIVEGYWKHQALSTCVT